MGNCGGFLLYRCKGVPNEVSDSAPVSAHRLHGDRTADTNKDFLATANRHLRAYLHPGSHCATHANAPSNLDPNPISNIFTNLESKLAYKSQGNPKPITCISIHAYAIS